VTYTEEYEDNLDIKKDHVYKTLEEFLPKGRPILDIYIDNMTKLKKQMKNVDCVKNKAEFVDVVYKDYESFKPVGEKIKEYEKEDSTFEIYKAS
jgi:hypothetical protein